MREPMLFAMPPQPRRAKKEGDKVYGAILALRRYGYRVRAQGLEHVVRRKYGHRDRVVTSQQLIALAQSMT